jgi:hypothetical protein
MVYHVIWIGGFVLLLWRAPMLFAYLVYGFYQLGVSGIQAFRMLTSKRSVEPTK